VAGKPRPYPSSLPGIAAHHGIWRELLTAISRNSVESHDDGKRKFFFPSAVSEATHDEWTVRQILVHLGLFSGIKRCHTGQIPRPTGHRSDQSGNHLLL